MTLNAKQQAQFNKLCEYIARGKSLVTICKARDMPGYSTITAWLREDEGGGLQAMYARAREELADYMADIMLAESRKGDDVQRSRLIVDTMKWTAAKLKPRVYGDRLDVQHTGNLVIGIKRNERIDDD